MERSLRLVFPSWRNRKTHWSFIAWVARKIFDSLLLIGFHFHCKRVVSHHFQLGQRTNYGSLFAPFWGDVAGNSCFIPHVQYAMNLQRLIAVYVYALPA